MFSYPKVVPQLVEDVSLKRARTESNGDDAIRVTTLNSADLTTVNTNTDSLVTSTDNIDTTTLAINTTQGSVSDAAWSGTGDATVISLLKGIVNKL